MPSVDSQDEFVVELVKSLNAMVDPKDRNKFSNTVSFEFCCKSSDVSCLKSLDFIQKALILFKKL